MIIDKSVVIVVCALSVSRAMSKVLKLLDG